MEKLTNLDMFGSGKPGTRIIGSILVMVLVFVLTVVLAMIDSSSCEYSFLFMHRKYYISEIFMLLKDSTFKQDVECEM